MNNQSQEGLVKGKSIAKRTEERSLRRVAVASMSRADVFAKYQRHSGDVGSPEVQCALLTKNIEMLTVHCNNNRKDLHSRRGLVMAVERRRRLLKYLERVDRDAYGSLIVSLGLRK